MGIFALIAGSYTPVAWCLLRGHWRSWTLAAVWSVAAAATILIAAGLPLFAGAGDLPVPGNGLGRRRLLFRDRAGYPIAPCSDRRLGGLSYSVGAVLNLLHWPVILPGIFGAHEIFHFFVLAGSLAHYRFILKVVVPFARRLEWRNARRAFVVNDLVKDRHTRAAVAVTRDANRPARW